MDLYAGVQEGEFPEALRQNVVVELDVAEGRGRRLEVALGAASLRLSDDIEGFLWYSMLIRLLVNLLISAHRQAECFRQCITDRDADPVKAARHFVAVLVELAAGV